MRFQDEVQQAGESPVELLPAEPVSVPVALRFLSNDSGLSEDAPMPGQGRFCDAEVGVAAPGARLCGDELDYCAPGWVVQSGHDGEQVEVLLGWDCQRIGQAAGHRIALSIVVPPEPRCTHLGVHQVGFLYTNKCTSGPRLSGGTNERRKYL